MKQALLITGSVLILVAMITTSKADSTVAARSVIPEQAVVSNCLVFSQVCEISQP